MIAKDTYHDAVRNALVKDGWTITNDPFVLVLAGCDYALDLGAERVVAAEKAGKRIAVGVNTALTASRIQDMELAFGRFLLYQTTLKKQELDRALFLAIPDGPAEFLDGPAGKVLIAKRVIQVVVFDPRKEEILRWSR